MIEETPVKYPKWGLSSQMDSGAFVILITLEIFFFKKSKNSVLRISEFLTKLKLSSGVTREF